MVPNPMNKWDDLGGFPPIFGWTPMSYLVHPLAFERPRLLGRFEFPHPWSSFFLCYPWSKLEKQHTDDTCSEFLGGFFSKVDLLAVCLDVSYLRLFSVWLFPHWESVSSQRGRHFWSLVGSPEKIPLAFLGREEVPGGLNNCRFSERNNSWYLGTLRCKNPSSHGKWSRLIGIPSQQ